jgi:hypothetical protein
MASVLPVRARGGQIYSTVEANEADLHMSTVDTKGRLALRRPASSMGWASGQDLALTLRDGVVLLSHSQHAAHARAGVVALDSRWRVLLPYGIRVQIGWEPAVRLMILADPIDGFVAALPVSRVAAALLRSP